MTALGLGNDDIVPGLELDQYRQQIKLDEPYQNECGSLLSTDERATIVVRLLNQLIHHERLADPGTLPETYESRRQLLRGLLNVRPSQPMDGTFIDDINRLLHSSVRLGFCLCLNGVKKN